MLVQGNRSKNNMDRFEKIGVSLMSFGLIVFMVNDLMVLF